MKTNRNIIFLIMVVLFQVSCAHAQTDQRLYVRTDNIPEGNVWNGQQVLFSVTLSMSHRPMGNPLFSIPEIPGGILLAVPGSVVFGNEERNNIAYRTRTYYFAFYPHRAGSHLISPMKVRVNFRSDDGSRQKLSKDTESFAIESRLPKGAGKKRGVITATDLELTEKWHPDLKKVKVGDAVTRTIHFKAPDVLGMGFPPVPHDSVKGAAIYPNKPQIKDKIIRGDITGERIETLVYVFEKEGEVILPSMTFHWFDLAKHDLKTLTFAERSINVTPNPAFIVSSGPNNMLKNDKNWGMLIGWLVFIVVVFSLLAAGFRRLRKPVRQWSEKKKIKYKTSEPYYYNKLKAAVLSKDIKGVVNQAVPWLQSVSSFTKITTLTQLSNQYGNGEFRASVSTVMTQAFGKHSEEKDESSWKKTFLDGLAKARKQILRENRQETTKLPTINP